MNNPIIIAEAGVNHNGSVERALRMIDAAADAGAHYVKFQTFKADKLVTADARKADYQMANQPSESDSQISMLRALELSDDDFALLARHCRQRGIGFMSTPFDIDSADMLASLDMDYWKIPSGEITNLPLLRHIAAFNGKIILSTGMSTLDEVRCAVDAIEKAGTTRDNIILLHCTTEYPAPYADVNLRAMEALRTLGCAGTGYSDHTRGIEVSVAAAALGACVIEKHFTLSRSLPGPDHKASLEPDELHELCVAVRNVTMALGKPQKIVSPSERANINVARKSIVASRHIAKGDVFTADNITVKRPGNGLSPMLWDSVTGQKAPCDFAPDQPIHL